LSILRILGDRRLYRFLEMARVLLKFSLFDEMCIFIHAHQPYFSQFFVLFSCFSSDFL
jgi:hypothetical protein